MSAVMEGLMVVVQKGSVGPMSVKLAESIETAREIGTFDEMLIVHTDTEIQYRLGRSS